MFNTPIVHLTISRHNRRLVYLLDELIKRGLHVIYK